MNRVRSSVVAVSGISLAVAVGVSACGSVQQLSAKESVGKAMSSYQKAKSAKFVLSVKTTAADLNALNKADGDDPLSASGLATLNKLLAGDVTVSVQAPNGKTFGDLEKSDKGTSTDLSSITKDPQAYAAKLKQAGSFELALDYRGSALADLRVVNGVVYAKADVPSILRLAGEPQSELDDALEGVPSSLQPIVKAAHNQWVSIDVASALPKLLKDAQSSGGVPTPTASVNPATLQNLVDSLKSAFQKNATITKAGSGDRGTDYRLSAPIRQIANAVEPQLETLASQAGDTTGLLGQDNVSPKDQVRSEIAKLPNKAAVADIWVKDNKLTGFSIDLAQFDTKAPAGHKVLLDADIALNGGSVSAPAGATPIDVSALVKDLQSDAGDFSSGSGTDVGDTGIGKLDVKALQEAGFSKAEIKRLQQQEKEYGSGK